MRLSYRFSLFVMVVLAVLLWAAVGASASTRLPVKPVFARSIVVMPDSGVVRVTMRGRHTAQRLRSPRVVPSGSLVDVSGPGAKATLVVAAQHGATTYVADISGAVFRVSQPRHARGETDLRVIGNVPACTAGRSAILVGPATVSAHKHKHRRSAADARGGGSVGRWRLIGNNQSAVNSGAATWQDTEDCHGTTMADSTGSVSATLANGDSTNSLGPGMTWISRCTAHAESAVIGPYCVGLLAAHFGSNVLYTPGLFVTTSSSTYDMCETSPDGSQSCDTWAFFTTDEFGDRDGLNNCWAAQAGLYSVSWRLGGVPLGISLPYTSPAASRETGPCDGTAGVPYSTGNFNLFLPNQFKIVNSYALPTPAQLEDISVDLVGQGSGKETLTGVVYKDVGGSPGSLMATTQPCVVRGKDTSNCQPHLSFSPQVNVPAGTYWFGLLASGKSKIAGVQEGHTALAFLNNNPLSVASDPFGALYTDKIRLSLQIDYLIGTPSGG